MFLKRTFIIVQNTHKSLVVFKNKAFFLLTYRIFSIIIKVSEVFVKEK